MSKPNKALAALLLAATSALPCAAQETRPAPLPIQACAGCFAYLEFPPALEPQSHVPRGQVIERPAALPGADAASDRPPGH